MIGVGLAVAGPLDDERGYGGGRDGDPRARVLAALADAGVVAPGLCHAAVQLLAVSGGSVSLLTEGRYGATLCVSDEVAARLEALYLTLGEGPGLDAHHHGRLVGANGTVRNVGVGGTVLGIMPGVQATAVDLELDRGDALLLYTDGLTEGGGANPCRRASCRPSCEPSPARPPAASSTPWSTPPWPGGGTP